MLRWNKKSAHIPTLIIFLSEYQYYVLMQLKLYLKNAKQLVSMSIRPTCVSVKKKWQYSRKLSGSYWSYQINFLSSFSKQWGFPFFFSNQETETPCLREASPLNYKFWIRPFVHAWFKMPQTEGDWEWSHWVYIL